MSTHYRALTASDLQRDISGLIGPRLQRLQSVAVVLAIAGAVLCILGYITHPAGFWHGYLLGLVFWTGASTGSLALLMLHHTTGGGWGYILRRFWEAATLMLGPMLVLALIFVAFGVPHVYSWARPDVTDPVVRGKLAYLNWPFFAARTVIYFAIWMLFAAGMRRWAAILDERDDPRAEWRLNVIGAFGMVIYVLTTTFLGVDWIMSLTPKWLSSIFGFILVVSQTLTSITLMVVLLSRMAGDRDVVRDIPSGYFRDIGNLTLALIILWAYMSFSQYLLQYSGNLLEEIAWYLPRRSLGITGWGWYSILAIPLHFLLPFIVLLVGSGIKRDPNRLAKVAAMILVFRVLDVYWWIGPTFYNSWISGWADIGSLLFIGGIWLGGWAYFVGRARTLVPLHDPRVEPALGEVPHHA